MRRLRRHPWRTATGALVAAGLIAFVIVWFAPQALFINTTVNEPVPVTAEMVSGAQATATGGPAATAVPRPQTLARGDFRSLEHHTTGSAQLLRLADGTVVLRIEDLDTSNGPDVRVTLSPTPSDRGDRDYADHLDLGALKGNKGSQNYVIPAGTGLDGYRSVVIWCRRFSVGFGVAPIA